MAITSAMMIEAELLGVLKDWTSLIVALVRGKATVEEFLRDYDNFYYYNALDGHETNPAQRTVLDAHQAVCQLHEKVQGIVDLVDHSDVPLPDYEAAGRIRPAEVGQRIVALATELDVVGLLDRLRGNGE